MVTVGDRSGGRCPARQCWKGSVWCWIRSPGAAPDVAALDARKQIAIKLRPQHTPFDTLTAPVRSELVVSRVPRSTIGWACPRSKARGANPRSLKVSDGFKSFVLDQLEELGDVMPKSMFGGVGLYRRGVFFGILARDTLYLKVNDTNLADYLRAGMKPFRPYPNRSGTMRYYSVPLDVLESPPDLAAWARKAIAVASGA